MSAHRAQCLQPPSASTIEPLSHDRIPFDLMQLRNTPHDRANPGATLTKEIFQLNHRSVQTLLST